MSRVRDSATTKRAIAHPLMVLACPLLKASNRGRNTKVCSWIRQAESFPQNSRYQRQRQSAPEEIVWVAFRPSRIREERVECVDFGMSAESYYVYEIQPVSSRAFRWADREQEIVGSNRGEDSKMDQLNGSSCRISRTTWSACAESKSSTPKSASGNSAGLNAQHTCLV